MNEIRQIHAHTLRIGINHTAALVARLLAPPAPDGLPYARALFDLLPSPPPSLYDRLLRAYSSLGRAHQCLSLFLLMRASGRPPTPRTFTPLFSACAALPAGRLGRQLHTHFLKLGFPFDSFIGTSMQDMYAKCGLVSDARRMFVEMPDRDVPTWNSMVSCYARCGEMEEARALFEVMPGRNVVSWTSMVSGYSQNGRWEEALEMYLRMEQAGEAMPNAVTLASVLPACARLGALAVGERICKYAKENGLLRNAFVGNALIEMYAKCGRIERAREVFEGLGTEKNLCSWNSMITSLAVHGRCKDSLNLFHEMLAGGLAPDDMTITGVLLACTHGGLVEEAQQIFDTMERQFSLTPKLQHYGCVVDLLGRAGLLEKAYHLIKSMPMKPDSVVWGALLGACSFHRNVELAEIAAEYLFKLEPSNSGNYVILSNIYASSGRWDGVSKMWKLMKGNYMRKAAGHSFIEVGGCIHKFLSEDRSHPRSDEIYHVLNEIMEIMKPLYCVPYLDLELECHA